MLFKFKAKGFFRGFTINDLIYLLIFPAIITLLMFLPDYIKTSMILNLKNPQWWQVFTSGFIHQSWNHLLGNLRGYFLIVFPLFFLIATRTKKKKYYFRLMLFTILTFPIAGSLFQIHFYPQALPSLIYSSGSSGIVASLAGFIPSFWLLSVLNKKNQKVRKGFALISMTYLALLFSIIYFQIYQSLVIILFLGISLIILLFSYRKRFLNVLGIIDLERKKDIISELIILFVMALFLAAPFLFFPFISSLNNNGSLTDFLIHYIGIFYGLMVSFGFFSYIHKETRE